MKRVLDLLPEFFRRAFLPPPKARCSIRNSDYFKKEAGTLSFPRLLFERSRGSGCTSFPCIWCGTAHRARVRGRQGGGAAEMHFRKMHFRKMHFRKCSMTPAAWSARSARSKRRIGYAGPRARWPRPPATQGPVEGPTRKPGWRAQEIVPER